MWQSRKATLTGGHPMRSVPPRELRLSALVAAAPLAGALFITTPKASAGLGQCPENAVCVWQFSDATGDFSWWPASDTGCHAHANNPNIRAAWNRTANAWVNVGGAQTIAPNVVYSRENPPITGQICWPV
jgi:hypothetical protein